MSSSDASSPNEYLAKSVNEGSLGFYQRFKKSPILTLGTMSGLGVVGYMLFNLTKKDPSRPKLSVYLIHTRLYAQCTVVAFIGLIAFRETYYKHRQPNGLEQKALEENTGP